MSDEKVWALGTETCHQIQALNHELWFRANYQDGVPAASTVCMFSARAVMILKRGEQVPNSRNYKADNAETSNKPATKAQKWSCQESRKHHTIPLLITFNIFFYSEKLRQYLLAAR